MSGHIRTFLGAALLAAILSACSPISQNSLLTNQSSQPSTHSVSLTPTEDEIYIKADSPAFYNPGNVSRFDISGECFPSTFPGHAIYVYLNGAKQQIVDISATASAANSAQCNHGRFNIGVITSSLPAGGYSMKVQLVGLTSSGTEAVNLSRGVSSFSVTKYAPGN